MKNYLRLLKLLVPYKGKIILSVFLNILTVFFSLTSITFIVPILKIIFNNTQKVTSKPVYTNISGLKDYIGDYINYIISNTIEIHGTQYVLTAVILVAGLFFLLKNAIRYWVEYIMVHLKNTVERDVRNLLHQKILNMPIGQLNEQRKGDLMARLTNDILEIQWAIFSSIQRLIQDPLMIIFTIIVLISFSYKLTLFVIVLIPITGFVITTIGNSLKKPSEKAKEELGKLLSYIEENIGALPAIRSYNAEERVHQHFMKSNQSYFRAMNQMLSRRELSSPVSEVLGSYVMLAIIGYGSVLILQNKELSPEVFITYIVLFYQIINPAKSLSTAIYDIKRGEASAERIFTVLDMPNPIQDLPNAIEKQTFDDKIHFENIVFSYQPDLPPAINTINFEVRKGQKVALVGQSGSGKSTIASLINRFYDVNSGKIMIDNLDIKALKQKDLHQLIGYIPQEPHLFNDSILNNLLLGKPNATKQEIESACKAANALEFILQTENGFETVIGDRGNKLSGGQRQRLTIARAILKNPPILVLDEATSALDAESEKWVQDALTHIMKDRTSIVIAHRLSTVQDADLIIVLKEGKIIERGTHESLIQQQGEYYKLVQLQNLN